MVGRVHSRLVKISVLAAVQRTFADDDQTDLIAELNGMIARGSSGVYTGGKGVLVRNPFDTYEDAQIFNVVPSTFWSNDIFSPSQLFPSTSGADKSWNTFPFTLWNPDCPNSGDNGYFNTVGCIEDPGNPGEWGPWNYAGVAYVVGRKMGSIFYEWDHVQDDDWGWGVFYPTDSNSVDWRCRWIETDGNYGYDCRIDPNGDLVGMGGWIDGNTGIWADNDDKGGTGSYPMGNPNVADVNVNDKGGGTGCHVDKTAAARHWTMDQTDGWDSDGDNLVQDHHCQCNYKYKDDWKQWVFGWIYNAQSKGTTKYAEDWLGPGGKKAPSRGLDQVSCWLNNPRDMIQIQNHIWWARDWWSNQLTPASNWGSDPASMRPYWGWNEIPVNRYQITDPTYHDTVIVKIPAASCGDDGGRDSLDCLTDGAKKALENDFDKWVQKGYLIPGVDHVAMQPGSYLSVVREWASWDGNQWNWQKYFFCENWYGPSGKWKIVFEPMSASNPTGACYLEWGSSNLKMASNSTVAV